MTTVFTANPKFHPVPTPADLATLLTDFEQEWLAQGRVTHRAAYQYTQPT